MPALQREIVGNVEGPHIDRVHDPARGGLGRLRQLLAEGAQSKRVQDEDR